jgi:hypothetical protein
VRLRSDAAQGRGPRGAAERGHSQRRGGWAGGEKTGEGREEGDEPDQWDCRVRERRRGERAAQAGKLAAGPVVAHARKGADPREGNGKTRPAAGMRRERERLGHAGREKGSGEWAAGERAGPRGREEQVGLG